MLSPGKLPYKKICHIAICGFGNDPTESSVVTAIRYGLQLVSEHRFERYVFPAFGKDSGGMPYSMAADILIRELAVYADNKFVEKVWVKTNDPHVHAAHSESLKKFTKKR